MKEPATDFRAAMASALEAPTGEDAARLNWSTLRHLATSPKLLKWRLEHPQPETLALRLGRAIHCAILEPEAFGARWMSQGVCAALAKNGNVCSSTGSLYFEGKWYCRVRGHAPEGAGDPPAGVEVIPNDERALALLLAKSVKDHAVAAGALKDGKPETLLKWTDPESGILCRGRLDYLKAREVVDVKSSHADTIQSFVREFAGRLYHGQLAWYHDGAVAAGQIPADAPLPIVIHVSTTEPYDVAVYRLSKYTYQAGQILYRDLLRKYADCRAADWWPGFAPDLLELDLPDWARGMRGSEESMEEIL